MSDVLDQRDRVAFGASLVRCRLNALRRIKYLDSVQAHVAAASRLVAFVVGGPARTRVGDRDPNGRCDIEALEFDFLHDTRFACFALAARYLSDQPAAVDVIHAFVFDGIADHANA